MWTRLTLVTVESAMWTFPSDEICLTYGVVDTDALEPTLPDDAPE